MGRHLLFTVFLWLFQLSAKLFAANGAYTIFPLCAVNADNQSERLNHFHTLMSRLGEEMKFSNLQSVPSGLPTIQCESSMRRSVAALYNFEGFLQGEYSIDGDSVTISLQLVNTHFIDKTLNLEKVEGNIHHFNDVIYKMALNTLKAMALNTDTLQNFLIARYIEDDEKKYLVSNSNITVAELDLGKLAYSLGNYAKATETLNAIEPGDAQYGEAQFILGKCVLLNNDFHAALVHFNTAEKAGFKDVYLSDYIFQAELLNKPAVWYDTEKKRREWWQQLNSEEALQIIQLMNGLKVNNKKFKTDYTFTDSDISVLFQTEVLSLEDAHIIDFNAFRTFTKVSFILLEGCKLESGNGIEYFQHLKMIKSDKASQLEIPILQEYIANHGITKLTK